MEKKRTCKNCKARFNFYSDCCPRCGHIVFPPPPPYVMDETEQPHYRLGSYMALVLIAVVFCFFLVTRFTQDSFIGVWTDKEGVEYYFNENQNVYIREQVDEENYEENRHQYYIVWDRIYIIENYEIQEFVYKKSKDKLFDVTGDQKTEYKRK